MKTTENQAASMKLSWKHQLASIRFKWPELSEDELAQASESKEQLVRVLSRHYGSSSEQAAAEVENLLGSQSGKTQKKDIFQKLSEMNGNMKINQYVENPAPGPSTRRGPQGENRVRGKRSH
ncbi:MAG TPA: hypothetical protein VF050_09350 [Moraxellaceae bacterium]